MTARAFSPDQKKKIISLVEQKDSNAKTLEDLKNSFNNDELTARQYGSAKAVITKDNSRISNEILNIKKEVDLNKFKETVEKVTSITEGIESINIEIAKDQEQADKIAEDKNLQKKASIEQGYILQDPKTGEQTIVINEEIAKKDFAVNVAAHELLHGVLFKTIVDNPQTAINLGNALKLELDKIDASKVKDSKFKERLELY